MSVFHIITGDCRAILKSLRSGSVNCVVTSPPYWGLRDYGIQNQIGLEQSPSEYVEQMRSVFSEVRRVLRDDGTLWLNLGDSYASAWVCSRRSTIGAGSLENGKRANRPNRLVEGLKEKDLVGIPWRVAFALQQDGWYLRQDIIWAKPNPMPESVRDRCTKSHEYLFMFSKSKKYFYDADAVAEPVTDSTRQRLAQPNLKNQNGSARVPGKTNGNMKAVIRKQDGHGRRHAGFNERFFNNGGEYPMVRNRRSVWNITTQPFKDAHFATFPPALVEPCILAGCPENGVVLDPFAGAGTTGLVAMRLDRNSLLLELNPAYAEMAQRRIEQDQAKRAPAQNVVDLTTQPDYTAP